MKTTRRQFIRRALWSVPVVGGLGTLPGCGGGGGGGSPSTATSYQGSGSVSNAGAPSAGADLSVGLKDYGLTNIPFVKVLAKPPKGATVSDPEMPGATITRITDVQNDFAQYSAVNAIPAYPTTQAWNCDESFLFLYIQGGSSGFHTLYDGTTYAYIKNLNVNPSDIEQMWWDRKDPNTLYYISNGENGSTYYSQMVSYNVQTDVITVVFDFAATIKANGWAAQGPVRAGYPFFIGGQNNDIWGLGCCGIPDINGYLAGNVFGFQRSTGKIFTYQGLASAQMRTNFPTPLPSGNGWFYNNTSAAAASGYVTDIYDFPTGAKIGTVPFSSDEHIGSNQNVAGDDYIVGVQYDTALQGNMIVANLSKQTVATLVGQSNGYGYPRTGALAASACYNNPGWCVTGIVGSPYGSVTSGTPASASGTTPTGVTMLDQEVVIGNSNSNPGVVRRVCRHRSTGYWTSASTNNYWAQPNVTLSPSGTRILVQSDWGNANPAAPVINPNAYVDTYVITLPAYFSS